MKIFSSIFVPHLKSSTNIFYAFQGKNWNFISSTIWLGIQSQIAKLRKLCSYNPKI